ncbi:hypothetical protein HCU74_14215 [Spongiibacter sp. KMU-166]|uniref:Nucleoside-diphosphate sugar epimerase n=1 Tax=Spongiibacter thalassae TaxID=2721624 RepID=A0ABX1GHC1_9GAMM|nr:ELM1/GtrOC1 family putative glycosyltransferase [Spongiibacter thalassae]NKI18568.1 hypothetical protein [Spongiibacter thalassae]
MGTINILVIYDGKPGHLSQSLGLAKLIQQRLSAPVAITVMRAKPRAKLLNRPLREVAAWGRRSLCRGLLTFYNISALPGQRPDLIISFGGNVVALNVALKRLWQSRNIAIGNIYCFAESDFDAHITGFGKEGQVNAVASHIAMCSIDRHVCDAAGRAMRDTHPTPLWALFVGGDGSGYRYTVQDWQSLAQALNTLAEIHGIRWLLSTSRRTGSEGLQCLQHYLDSAAVASSIWYGEANATPLTAYLGAASRIFCSEDSLSMLSESVAMNKPVVAFSPAERADGQTHHEMVAHMQSSGLLERWKIADLAEYQPTPYAPALSYDEQLTAIFRQLVATGVLRNLAPTSRLVHPLVADAMA